MDTTDPEIIFDEEGVCNHCHHFDARAARELFGPDENLRRLSAVVERIKQGGRGKEYDCILGVSGGVDSSYLAYQAKELGLRPLAVHFDNGWDAELAVDNIKKILTVLDIDLHTYVVDWDEFCDLQKAFLEASVPNAEIPSDHGINAVMWNLASKYGLKYILSGSNLRTEGVMPLAWTYTALDYRHIRAIHRQFGSLPLRTFPKLGLFKFSYYVFAKRIRTVNLLNLLPYDKAAAVETLRKKFDWRPYEEKHYESVWTRYYQGYYLPTKFGFDKRRPHISTLILSGQITRIEALKTLKNDTYPKVLLKRDHEFVLKKFGFSDSDLRILIEHPNKTHMDYANLSKVYLRSSRMMNLLRKTARAV